MGTVKGMALVAMGALFGFVALVVPAGLLRDGTPLISVVGAVAFLLAVAALLIWLGVGLLRPSVGGHQPPAEDELSLAMRYLDGRGVARQPVRAMEMVATLAEGGNPEAQFILGRMYQGDVDPALPTDLDQAVSWYRRSAEGGHPYAQNSMAQLSYASGHNYHAFVWAALALKNGEPEARTTLQWASDQLEPDELREAQTELEQIASGKAPSGRFATGL